MKNSLVSVIVPCYNQADYIVETLNSVKNQTYDNWECIIVNDGSKDKSAEIILAYIKDKPQFTLINQENSGVAIARNNGIENSKGFYILPLDGDDLIHKDYLKRGVQTFYDYPESKLVYCKAEFFGAQNEYWPLPPYEYERFIIVNCIFNCAFFKRSDYNNTKGFDAGLKYGYEDWDFYLQLLSKEDKVTRIDAVLFYYRQHEVSRNDFNKNKKELDFTLKYVYKKHKRHYRSNFFLRLPYDLFIDDSYTYGELDKIKNSFSLLWDYHWNKFKLRYLKFNKKH